MKRFGGLLENALRLLGALEDVADLLCGGHLDGQLFSQQQRKFVAEQYQAWIGDRDGKRIVLHFERDEVVAEHQVRGNGAEQFGIDALLA